MKKIILFTITVAICLIFNNKLEAQISVGGGFTYGLDIEDIGIQVGGTYGLTPEMRVGADIVYWLVGEEINHLGGNFEERINYTYLEVNANFNYIFYDESDLIIYGIGTLGIHYFSFEDGFYTTGSDGHGHDIIEGSDTEAALGVGGGFEYNLGIVKLYAEPRFFLSGFDQLTLAAGVRVPIN